MPDMNDRNNASDIVEDREDRPDIEPQDDEEGDRRREPSLSQERSEDLQHSDAPWDGDQPESDAGGSGF